MTDNYSGTPLLSQIVNHRTECHVRDFAPVVPKVKRRVTVKLDVKASRGIHISARELELYALIDGHIARLQAERETAQ